MIEIVFNESACGNLKIAQHYGEGEYSGGIPGFCFYGDETPTEAEIQTMQKEFTAKARLEWENAVPMGGNPQDVFGFELSLSIGDISSNNFISKRKKIMEDASRSVWPDADFDDINDVSHRVEKKKLAALSRIADGEDVRIWYSNTPDDMCGLYWFMSELYPHEGQLGSVHIVKLPEHLYNGRNIIAMWGEVPTGELSQYAVLAETTTSAFRQHCANQWINLQQENAPSRVVLNGQLVSASESIYDYYIYNEIEKVDEEFQESKIILNVMDTLPGVPGSWFHLRIEKMIRDGKLVVIKGPEEDHPVYSRVLRKATIDA